MKIIAASKTETEKIRTYYGTVILSKPTALKGCAEDGSGMDITTGNTKPLLTFDQWLDS